MTWIEQAAHWLTTNPLYPIATFLVGFSLSVYGVWQRIRSTKVQLPRYAIRSINVVEELHSNLPTVQMLHNGQPIRNLTVTKVVFWNGGGQTINGSDVVKADPIRITLAEGYMILEPPGLSPKNSANEFAAQLSADGKSISLTFDYVDKDEGVILQILHTGKSSADVSVQGKIKGVGTPTKITLVSSGLLPSRLFRVSREMRNSRWGKLIVVARFALLAFLVFVFPLMYLLINVFTLATVRTQEEAETARYYNIGLGVAVCMLYWGYGFYRLKRRIPKGFESFFELPMTS